MVISVHTCRGYLEAVYAKLQVNSQVEAVNRTAQLQQASGVSPQRGTPPPPANPWDST
jgi:hypothetical protein